MDPSLKKAIHIADEIRAICIGGEGHACAEDVGVPYGWEDLKESFKPRKKDPKEKKDWYEYSSANGDTMRLDLYKWNILDVNDGLMELNEEWFRSLSVLERNKKKIVKEREKNKEKEKEKEKERTRNEREKKVGRHERCVLFTKVIGRKNTLL